MNSTRRIAGLLIAALLVALAMVPAADSASPSATASKRCGKGMALLRKSGKSRCVKRCPKGYAKKRKSGRLVCARKPAPAPQLETLDDPSGDTNQAALIEGDEAKTVLRGLLVHHYFEGTQNSSGGGSSVSGREGYGFCNTRYGWASQSFGSTEFGSVDSSSTEGGTWAIDQAVADPGRRKAQGTLTLTPDGGKAPHQIDVFIDADGTDRLAGYNMESDPAGFDCANAAGG